MQTSTQKRVTPRKRGAAIVAALTLALIPVSPAAAVTPPPTATCKGVPATIIGTSAGDRIIGTPGDDVIVGLGGDDWISGEGGNDIICGNGGFDSLEGGDGNDRLYGGPSADYLVGDRGNDRLFGQQGNDQLAGTSGNDRNWGGAGDDIVNGGLGKDKVSGGQGADSCIGDEFDIRSQTGCERYEWSTYRTVTVNLTGSGGDPTGSNYGDPYFAGAIVEGLGPPANLPSSTKILDGKDSFRIRVPAPGYLEITNEYVEANSVSGGYQRIPAGTGPMEVTIDLNCCALLEEPGALVGN